MKLREFSETPVVVVKKHLNPLLWSNGVLNPEIAKKLVEIALAFESFVGVDLPVKDYTITGSNANFTWTEHSDLDLHIIIPGVPDDQARELYSSKKALWAEQHDITIKGLPVEVYVQGADEPHHSTGVYSLMHGEWIVKPKKVKPQVDDAAISAKKEHVIHAIEKAMISRDLEQLRTVKEKVVKMRKAGLERAGEWSTENLVFKILRNLGLIDRMVEMIRELEDAELSLETIQPGLLD